MLGIDHHLNHPFICQEFTAKGNLMLTVKSAQFYKQYQKENGQIVVSDECEGLEFQDFPATTAISIALDLHAEDDAKGEIIFRARLADEIIHESPPSKWQLRDFGADQEMRFIHLFKSIVFP